MDRIQILPDNEVSAFLGPNETTVNYKSFMETRNHDPHFKPPPVRSNFVLTGNLNSEFSRIADENCKNNTTEPELLPEPSSKETVRVYLRVKPKTEEESQYYSMASTMTDGEDEEEHQVDERKPPEGEVVSIESDHQIALNAPSDSNAYKNSINNGNGKLTHRYTFTKIFSPKIDQGELFSQMVLPRVQGMEFVTDYFRKRKFSNFYFLFQIFWKEGTSSYLRMEPLVPEKPLPFKVCCQMY